MRQIGEMLTTVDSTCQFLINKPDTVMSFKALRQAITLSGIPSIPICTDISKFTLWSISRLLNIIELNLFSKWKHVECNHTTHLMNICYSSHYARKYKGQSEVYPQEAEHFV